MRGASNRIFSPREAVVGANRQKKCDESTPFREGNGRSTREYIRCLAMSNGYTLEWEKVNKNELLHASKISVINTSKLEQLIYQAIKENEPSKEIIEEWKKAELENDELEL